MNRGLLIFGLLFVLLFVFAATGFSAGEELKPYIDSVEQAKSGMTLWQMIKSGGLIMVILSFFSIGVLALTVYLFLTLKMSVLCPREFSEDVIKKLEQGKTRTARELCASNESIIARIVISGIDKKPKGAVVSRESMELCARNEVGRLWQVIGYLGDIATVAPLLGLLGTVLGMIQAFNVVAFQTAVVKPILLAGGVSKAMITTAGGLIVAIPAMLIHAYFRGKVQEISQAVENYSSDLIKFISES